MDKAGDLALFLLERTNSVFGRWSGRMSAAEQRALLGRYLGRGRIVINGEMETVVHVVTRCFGHDYEVTADLRWRDL